jgi:hypothetical protein
MQRMIWITALLAASCGGGSNNGDGGGGLPSTLAGTWDLSASSGVGALTLSSSRLQVSMGGAVFDLQLGTAPSLAWTDASGALAIQTTQIPATVDFGVLPLGLGGDWTFAAKGASCAGSIRADSATGGCTNAGRPPSALPSLNRHVTAHRTATSDSIFGALGGTWSISDDGAGSCSANFVGATLTASCKSGSTKVGGITVTFSDGLASGSTDSGAEFSARRR